MKYRRPSQLLFIQCWQQTDWGLEVEGSYFRSMLRKVLSFELSSGPFSDGAFEGVEGLEVVVELATEGTAEGCSEGGPEEEDAMTAAVG